ncbi:unnamed protein product [Merluccius merluccius]
MPFPTGGPEAGRGMGGAEAPGELPSDDAYSDLHYDPDWRSKLKASERFSDSLQPQEEHLPDSTGRSRGDYFMGEKLVIKGGYRYIVAASHSFPPGPPSNMAQDEARGPYHLHPQHGVAGNSGYPDHQTTQTRSNALLLPEANQTPGKEDTAVQRESSHGDTGEHHNVPAQPQPSQNVQEVAAGKRSKNTSKLKSPLLAYRNLERTREDIVERNKITLGRNTAKCGSYLKAHAPKQETDNMMRWEAPEEEEEEEEVMLHGAEFSLEEEDLDQELMWLQKTQQLKQKGKPNPWRPTRAPRPGEAHRPGHRLCPPPGGGGGGGGARPQARKELNLKNTPPVALPPISSSGDSTHSQTPPGLRSLSGHGTEASSTTTTTRASWGLHGVSDWENETSLGYLDVPFPGDVHAPWRPLHGAGGRGLVALGYHQPKRGNPPQGFQNKIASRGQRAQAPQWLLSYDEEHILIHNVDEDIFPQDSPRWVGEVQLRRSGSHLVLPPIGDGGRPVGGGGGGGGGGGEPQLSPGPVSPIVSPSTPGYLAHIERQKQLKERVTYKVYTLKDYRQLKQVVNLCGLGPDKANEKTAEKMRRQRLYSNVIREQNKKTSTIPPLPPKDPEDIDKTIPRRKALEYAKRIAKPHPKPQPKKHQDQSEGFPGLLGSAHLEGLDLAQLKALDDMRRRHEEEKRAVASFRKVHVV